MKKSVFIAIAIILIAGLWVGSGLSGKGESDQPENSAEQAEGNTSDGPPEVRVRDMRAQEMSDQAEVTGRTQASRRVTLKAETNGEIIELLVEKGAHVETGQTLARIDKQDRGYRVEEARELLNQRDIQYKAAKELAEKGFNSQVRLAQAKAELETARTQLKQAQVALNNLAITAPFDGVIDVQNIELGDYVSAGTEVFEIVDMDPIEITGFVTEKLVGFVTEGDIAAAELLTGENLEGEISYVSPTANQETRTFQIEVTMPNEEHSIKEGLTAKIKIPVKDASAYKISPSILTLSDEGTVGVKIVNMNDEVEFMPIKLLKDTPDYLWVGGLPSQIRIITVGQEFVINGQKVKPVMEDAGAE